MLRARGGWLRAENQLRKREAVMSSWSSKLVLDDEAFDSVVTSLESDAAPTEALRELMRDQGR